MKTYSLSLLAFLLLVLTSCEKVSPPPTNSIAPTSEPVITDYKIELSVFATSGDYSINYTYPHDGKLIVQSMTSTRPSEYFTFHWTSGAKITLAAFNNEMAKEDVMVNIKANGQLVASDHVNVRGGKAYAEYILP